MAVEGLDMDEPKDQDPRFGALTIQKTTKTVHVDILSLPILLATHKRVTEGNNERMGSTLW